MKTESWHAPRIGRITGSRVGAILGHSQWHSRDDVMREMVREALGALREFEGNEATAYGEEHEADAIAAYELERDVNVTRNGDAAPFCVHPEVDWLGVRPDGFVEGDSEGIIEVKCPWRARYRSIREHLDYMAQVQLALECTGAAWCDFIIWRAAEPLIVERVLPNDDWLPSVRPELEMFMADYRMILATEELAAPYLAERERTDEPWRAAALAYRRAAHALDAAQAAEASARQVLLEMAPNGGKGCGVAVTRAERKGSIAYAKAIKDLLPNADLSAYQGTPTIYYQVRTV